MLGLTLHRSRKLSPVKRLTGALLDRLTHRVHILEANGQSYRLQDAKGRLKRK